MKVRERNIIDRMLGPESIAVVGASSREGSLGNQVMKKVTGYGFTGKVYPVNPKTPEIMGHKAYTLTSKIPGPVDTAVICVPGQFVIDVIEDLHIKGVRSCIIISAGFKETGPEGIRREKELTRLAREYGIRVVGPNCFGIINGHPDTSLDCTFARNFAPRGHVGFISQSGAVGAAVNEDLRHTKMGLSVFVTLGNRIDFDENEAMEYLARDENTRVIMMYLENFANPQRFMETARRVTREKPVIVLKAGRSEMGAAAAASHTGQLAQSDSFSSALLDRSGCIRVFSVPEMINAAKALYPGIIPRSPELAVVTNAGGFGVMAMDRAEELGVKLARLAPETKDLLKSKLPPEASCQNPVDLLGTATHKEYGDALEGLLMDPGVGAVIYNFGPPVMQKADPIAEKAAHFARIFPKKPILSIYMNRRRIMEPLRKAWQEEGVFVPQFDYPEEAAWAYSKLIEYGQIRQRPLEKPPVLDVDIESARAIISRATQQGRAQLDFDEGQDLLRLYGIPCVKSVKVIPGDDLADKIRGLKFPVAIKPAWGGVVHKTEMRAVRLNLKDTGEIQRAVDEISASIGKATGKPYDRGFMVQEMFTGGQEVILGGIRQESEMSLMMFGLGGIFVELLGDVSFGLAPLTMDQAMEMMEKTKGFKLLSGFRGKDGYATGDLSEALVRLSRLMGDHPQIQELDINPMMTGRKEGSSMAVDVRVILKKD